MSADILANVITQDEICQSSYPIYKNVNHVKDKVLFIYLFLLELL